MSVYAYGCKDVAFQPNIKSVRLYFVHVAATELVTRSIKVMMQSGCEEVCLCLGPNIASLNSSLFKVCLTYMLGFNYDNHHFLLKSTKFKYPVTLPYTF